MSKDLSKPFIQKLYEAKTLDEKFSVLESEVISSGFDAVLYTFMPKLSRLKESSQPVFQFSQAYTDIIDNYQKYNFSENDFTIRLVESGRLAIIDWWDEAEKLTLTEKEQHVVDITKNKFNVSKGITFPTLSNDLGLAGVSIVSFNKDYLSKKAAPKTLEHLKVCSRMYHDYTMVHHDARYNFILPILQSLTPKKKIVLKHLISGQPMKKITEESDITIRYADKLLIELRKEFGNISKNELIYFLGLLNITEYL